MRRDEGRITADVTDAGARREILARVRKALEANPELSKTLLRLHTSPRSMFPSHLVQVSAVDVTRVLVHEEPDAHVTLSVTSEGEVTLRCRSPDGHHSPSIQRVHYDVCSTGTSGNAAIRFLWSRLRDHRPARLSPLSERSAAILASLSPGDVIEQERSFANSPASLSCVGLQAMSAGVLLPLLPLLAPGMASLVEHLGEGRTEIGLDVPFAIALAARTRRPERVSVALRAVPFLRAALHPRHVTSEEPWVHAEALSDGVAPHRVLADVVAPLLPAGIVLKPVMLRSIGATDPGLPRLQDTLRSLVAFHEAHPSHRSLDGVETSNVNEMLECPVTARHVEVAHALLDGSGRIAARPKHLDDALVSLETSVKAFGDLLGGGAARDDVAHHVAFPPSRRHVQLVRIDRQWHADTARIQGELSTLTASILARSAKDKRLDTFPHLTRGIQVISLVTVLPLLDEAAYVQEGLDNANCVGSYAGRAWSGLTVGFSLVDVHGRSTLTYDLSPNDGSIRSVQHLGRRNRPPPPTHVPVERELRSCLALDASARKAVVTEIDRRKRGAPKEITADDVMTEEVAALLDIHFRNVSPWLTPSAVALGPVGWWRSVTAAVLAAMGGSA